MRRAGTEDGFLLDTDTASTRALHFQRPLRIDRRHATVLQPLRRQVLATHVEICGQICASSGDATRRAEL